MQGTTAAGAVTVIGLGDMGGALARAFLAGGRALTVYNRTAGRAAALVEAGATLAADLPAAAAASDLVVMCVTDYAAARALLDPAPVRAALAGRTLVQLSTGSPAEAEALAEWAAANRVDYLDGAVDAFPHQVGTAGGVVRVAGPASAWDRARERLADLGSVSHFGESPGSVCALDCAILACLVGTIWGHLQGAALCRAHGISASDYTAARMETYGQDAGVLTAAARRIDAGDFGDTEASVLVYQGVLARIVSASAEAGIDTGIAARMRDRLGALVDAGAAGLDVSAWLDLIENPPSAP